MATVEVVELVTDVNDNNIIGSSRYQRFVTVAMNKLRQNKNETHKRTTHQISYPEMDRGEGIACADKVKQTNNHRSRSRTRVSSFTKYGIKKEKTVAKKEGDRAKALRKCCAFAVFLGCLVNRFVGKVDKNRTIDSGRCNPRDLEH